MSQGIISSSWIATGLFYNLSIIDGTDGMSVADVKEFNSNYDATCSVLQGEKAGG
jgi:hypothetical protein